MLKAPLWLLQRPKALVAANYSAFNAFVARHWRDVAYQDMHQRAIVTRLARTWSSLDAAAKVPYELMAREVNEKRRAGIESGEVRPVRKQPPAEFTSGYQIFVTERYREKRARSPGRPQTVMFCRIATEWKNLTNDQRQMYKDRAAVRNMWSDCVR